MKNPSIVHIFGEFRNISSFMQRTKREASFETSPLKPHQKSGEENLGRGGGISPGAQKNFASFSFLKKIFLLLLDLNAFYAFLGSPRDIMWKCRFCRGIPPRLHSKEESGIGDEEGERLFMTIIFILPTFGPSLMMSIRLFFFFSTSYFFPQSPTIISSASLMRPSA